MIETLVEFYAHPKFCTKRLGRHTRSHCGTGEDAWYVEAGGCESFGHHRSVMFPTLVQWPVMISELRIAPVRLRVAYQSKNGHDVSREDYSGCTTKPRRNGRNGMEEYESTFPVRRKLESERIPGRRACCLYGGVSDVRLYGGVSDAAAPAIYSACSEKVRKYCAAS